MRQKPIQIYLSIIFMLSLLPHYTQAQTKQDSTTVNGIFTTLESSERYVDKFFEQGQTSPHNLPIGIKKTMDNITYTLAISDIKFGTQSGEVTLFMKMDMPQKGKTLIFGATGVKISYKGDLIGDVKLSLLSDVHISLKSMGDLLLKGKLNDKTGEGESNTYVALDCHGNFKEMSIDGAITLNRNTFKAASKAGTTPTDSLVTASFQTVISSWNDLIVDISFPPFEIKGAPGFVFKVSHATLDLSDTKNPSTFAPPADYFGKYFTLPNKNLWRGLYVDDFSLTLPAQFKDKKTGSPIKIEASHMLIDENGITADILGKNILPFESGDASGWQFSVKDFELGLEANNITGFGFGGEVGLPVSDSTKTQRRPYRALISKNDYLLKVSLGDSLKVNLFGAANLKLDPSSYLQLELKDKQFVPLLVMNGSMALNISGLKMDQILFTKLAISPKKFSVESMGYGGSVGLNNFPLSVSNIGLSAENNIANLSFDAKLNLMAGKIAAQTHLKLSSEYGHGGFKFKGLNVDEIKLDSVSLSGFKLDGEIVMKKNDPVYGNCFGGSINATFGALSSGVKVGVTALFGRKDFRYWYVQGQVQFPTGIPVGGVLSIDGFLGGAYYRMSSTGKGGLEAYAPDDKCSLGVKAGISYAIANKNAVNGDAVFEMNFLSTGGVKNIRFYGTAHMMVGPKTDDAAKLDPSKSKGDMSKSRAANSSPTQSGSSVAKSILPSMSNMKMGLNAYLTMDYDFPSKTFDADFKLMIDTPGGIIKGTGPDSEAGWAKIHFSPQTWYVKVGTPTKPIGLQIGLGPISLKTESYFMLGDELENALPPPQAVLDILHMTPADADYMKYPADMKAGKGVGFGSRLSFDTGDLTFLILYARFQAGMGFDLMLRDMSNYACEGNSKPVGFDGWYANGQSYAYLSGELGVKVHLLFINKKINIISGSTATLLQARFPNPTWIGGRMAIHLNVLGGLINANMNMKFSFGDACKLVQLGGDYSPVDIPLIADLTPLDKDKDVDVFLSPQATFNMNLGKAFDVEDDKGNTQTYRIHLEDFYIADSKGKKVEGHIKTSTSGDKASFESKEILPPYTDMKVYVSVNFEQYKNGVWTQVAQNGKPARETRTVNFTTGGAPNYIPLTNITYCYPVIGQKNFYQGESHNGYIQLKKGQTYLFPSNFNYNAVFTSKDGTAVNSSFTYNSANSTIDYTFPNVANASDYDLSFVAKPQAGQTAAAASTTTTTSSTIANSEGDSVSVDYTHQAAQKIIKDGSLKVLNYAFRSSQYNTFAQKMSALQLTPSQLYVNSDTRTLTLNSSTPYEAFDGAELIGNDYTNSVPLVQPKAILDDDYYTKDIAPLVYNWYPIKGISIANRDLSLGVPPIKAYSLYDGYLNYINSNTYNVFMSKVIPYVYELPYYYDIDFYDLRNKAANLCVKGIIIQAVMPLLNSPFLFMRKGNYKTQFDYILPGGKQGTSKQINYINTLDWRKTEVKH